MNEKIIIDNEDIEKFVFLCNFEAFISGKITKETFMQSFPPAQSSSTDTDTTKTKQQLITEIIEHVREIQQYISNKYCRSEGSETDGQRISDSERVCNSCEHKHSAFIQAVCNELQRNCKRNATVLQDRKQPKIHTS